MAEEKANSREICITFDDLPVVRVHDYIEREIITSAILSTLEKFDAPAAGFVIGKSIEGHFDLLESWLRAGHILGSHTYSHPDLNTVPIRLYIENIEKGNNEIEALLKKMKQTGRYFRYPLLHYGSNNLMKQEVADYLISKDLINAHVSIDTDDYLYNMIYEKLFLSADSVKIAQLGNEYVAHIIGQLEASEKLSEKILERSCKHILLLHANKLNSIFLYDILKELRTRNYKFISLDKALSDSLYSIREDYIGLKGISYLERLEKSSADPKSNPE